MYTFFAYGIINDSISVKVKYDMIWDWSGINEYSKADITIFPNSTMNWVFIELTSTVDQVTCLEICSMDGRVIREEKVFEKTTEHRLSTSKMDNGCYFVRIKSAENILGIGRFCVIH